MPKTTTTQTITFSEQEQEEVRGDRPMTVGTLRKVVRVVEDRAQSNLGDLLFYHNLRYYTFLFRLLYDPSRPVLEQSTVRVRVMARWPRTEPTPGVPRGRTRTGLEPVVGGSIEMTFNLADRSVVGGRWVDWVTERARRRIRDALVGEQGRRAAEAKRIEQETAAQQAIHFRYALERIAEGEPDPAAAAASMLHNAPRAQCLLGHSTRYMEYWNGWVSPPHGSDEDQEE